MVNVTALYSPKYFFFETKYLLDLPLDDSKILFTGPGVYPQIYHRAKLPEVLICKEI